MGDCILKGSLKCIYSNSYLNLDIHYVFLSQMAKRIILIASGNGSNVENICSFFEKDQKIFVVGVYTNNPKAKVIDRVFRFGIKT